MIRLEQDPRDPSRVRTVPFDVSVGTLEPEVAADPGAVARVLAAVDLSALSAGIPIAGLDESLLVLRRQDAGAWKLLTIWFDFEHGRPLHGADDGSPAFLFDIPGETDPVSWFWDHNDRALDVVHVTGRDDPRLTAPPPSPAAIAEMEVWADSVITAVLGALAVPVRAADLWFVHRLPEQIPLDGHHRLGEFARRPGTSVPAGGTLGQRTRFFLLRSGLPRTFPFLVTTLLDQIAHRLGIGGCSAEPALDPGEWFDPWRAFRLDQHRQPVSIRRPVPAGLPSAQEVADAMRRLRRLDIDPVAAVRALAV